MKSLEHIVKDIARGLGEVVTAFVRGTIVMTLISMSCIVLGVQATAVLFLVYLLLTKTGLLDR